MPAFSWTLSSSPPLVGGATAAGATSGAGLGEPVRRDFLLGDDGDLDFSTGDAQWATDMPAIAQECFLAVSMLRGEWFLDLDEGTPLFEEVLVENPNLERIRAIYRTRVLSVVGVHAVRSVALEFDRAARELSVDILATTDLGELRIEVTLP